MKKRIWIIGLLILGTLLFGSGIILVRADGGIFYPPDYPTAETAQKAFIYYQNGTEDLVIATSFQGNAKDFAWVIPTPSLPTIDKSNVELFNDLAKITNLADEGPGTVNFSAMPGLGGGTKSTPVEVISEKTIDVYDTAILKATDENALAKWLTDHGYTFPQDKESELRSYVENGWYFAVAKIQPKLINSGGIVRQLATGTLTPLRLAFKTEKIIYPMKLTRVALDQLPAANPKSPVNNTLAQTRLSKPTNLPITLYVLADHKTSQDLITTDWANWIDNRDIGILNRDLDTNNRSANVILGQKLFLTKMHDNLEINKINDDLIITQAPNDQFYPAAVYKTAGFWLENLLYLVLVPLIVIFFPIPLGLVFFVFVLLQIYVKKRWLSIIGSVYQILACLILPVIGLAIVTTNYSSFSNLLQQNGIIGGIISGLVLEVIGVYLTIKMIKRSKNSS